MRGEAAPPGCLFCSLADGEDEEALILERGETAYSVLNLYPYTNGHLVVVPFRHVALPDDLTEVETVEAWRMLARARRACEARAAPDGFNIGINLGKAAGAGVPDHLHLHLVPRWAGDANFMTPIADTRVLPEDIGETWRGLRKVLQALD